MRLYSTKHQSPVVSFQQALLTGQAPDGGLYMPEELPAYYGEPDVVAGMEYSQFALDISIRLLESEISTRAMSEIIRQAYDFQPEIKKIDDSTFCLELFHGPTFSFKDFGAQFMAKTMGYFIRNQQQQLTILVATSGDTGSAVAHAFHNVEGIRVVMLYPSGQVSPLQEKQLTTLGGNITVLEVEGTFDDCQALVKRAFADESIRQKINITSANSINIGRLIPQSFYYGWAVSRLLALGLENIVVCVPSGNFGNLTGGLFAQKMGLAVKKFIAAVNSNDVVPEYLHTGRYRPRPSQRTLSNAMDVGNPSNWARIRELYHDDYHEIRRNIWSTSVDDEATIQTIRQVYESFNYIIDPHTAVGFRAAAEFRDEFDGAQDQPILILSTAHAGKFHEIVKEALGQEVNLPPGLARVLELEKKTIRIQNNYNSLKEIVLQANRTI